MWYVHVSGFDKLIVALVRAQRLPILGRAARLLLFAHGADISGSFGPGLRLRHGAAGVVIHAATMAGRNVTIYQNVTIGRADIWRRERQEFQGFTIGDEAIICAGAALLTSTHLRVGEGTVVGANAVLTESTGDWEVWAGNPARRVGERERG